MRITNRGIFSLGLLGCLILLISDVYAKPTGGSSSHNIKKRNAWWSKKSISNALDYGDNIEPNYYYQYTKKEQKYNLMCFIMKCARIPGPLGTCLTTECRDLLFACTKACSTE
ncbi:unnamed protein product [Owenia fusiformis]|uniref:Uncharacterized protein n=1 Tax=Owenia fusiformis TaxID=6347 RepID=A0A8S4N566_OWEFU|nr:unnamed protein product [Owenia fusiformis]